MKLWSGQEQKYKQLKPAKSELPFLAYSVEKLQIRVALIFRCISVFWKTQFHFVTAREAL